MQLRRTIEKLALTLGLATLIPAALAQEPAPRKAPEVPHWMEYKRFTRGGDEILKDDAASRNA